MIDYRAIDDAAFNIGVFCSRWGRIHVGQTKEKYGTARVYCSFGLYNLHSLFFPQRIYRHKFYPKWLWILDDAYTYKIFTLINPIVIPYQQFIYRLAYKRAINAYPHIKENILSGADWQELLKNLTAD